MEFLFFTILTIRLIYQEYYETHVNIYTLLGFKVLSGIFGLNFWYLEFQELFVDSILSQRAFSNISNIIVVFDLVLVFGSVGLFLVFIIILILYQILMELFCRLNFFFKKEKIVNQLIKDWFVGRIDFEKNEVCCVCLVEFNDNVVKSKTCRHYFHRECIFSCIENHINQCPICKEKFNNLV
jgi:hypothetical protein